MKIRIYKKANGNVERIERDPAHYEDGLYDETFHPYVYLNDRNDRSKGYTVPEWFVIDDSDLPDCPIEFMKVQNGQVVEDTQARQQDEGRKNAEKQEFKDAVRDVQDPKLKKLIESMAKRLSLLD